MSCCEGCSQPATARGQTQCGVSGGHAAPPRDHEGEETARKQGTEGQLSALYHYTLYCYIEFKGGTYPSDGSGTETEERQPERVQTFVNCLILNFHYYITDRTSIYSIQSMKKING